jgi:hypothetical protein
MKKYFLALTSLDTGAPRPARICLDDVVSYVECTNNEFPLSDHTPQTVITIIKGDKHSHAHVRETVAEIDQLVELAATILSPETTGASPRLRTTTG